MSKQPEKLRSPSDQSARNRSCRSRIILLLAVLPSLIFSCGVQQNPEENTHTKKLNQLAIATVRTHISDPEAKLQVSSLEAVEWPDGSLGCPHAGMLYTQMIIPGYRAVVNELNGARRHFAVHIANDKAFVCKNKLQNRLIGDTSLAEPAPNDIDVVTGKAKQHLAEQLNIPAADILLRSVKELRWLAVDQLDCPALEEKIRHSAKPDNGYRLILQTNKKQHFIYYSNAKREVMPCDKIERQPDSQ